MKAVLGAFALVALVALAVLLGPVLLMFAWNLVVAGLFGGPTIGFWHAFAILVLVGFVRRIFTGKDSSS